MRKIVSLTTNNVSWVPTEFLLIWGLHEISEKGEAYCQKKIIFYLPWLLQRPSFNATTSWVLITNSFCVLVTGLSKPIFSNLILAMPREAREFVTAFIKIPSKVFKEQPPETIE